MFGGCLLETRFFSEGKRSGSRSRGEGSWEELGGAWGSWVELGGAWESREELERYLRTAKADLKNCAREMKALGFEIITEEGNGDNDETFTG